ncbi:uncharacterized protein ACNLHF_022729 [Anomaloglossus baeobatrachus]
MEWGRVVPEFRFHCKVERPPDVLVLHVGGNDLGARASRDLIRDVHLNEVGLDLWALGLQDGVERAFGVWRVQAT